LEEITTVVEWNKKYYPFIGVAIAAHYLKIDLKKIFLKEETMYFGSKKLGLTARAGFRANFGEPFKKYKHYSYSELLEDRLENTIKRKFIIIGFNATGLSDYQVTRTSNRYPGTEIHATFIDYMLNDF
jgi:CHASE2 domain-containing sensor protein